MIAVDNDDGVHLLIRFEAANYRSIREPIELSMVAVDVERPEARDVPNLGHSLLTVAAIFGPNASGKSNIIAAFAWLRASVHDSLRTWDDEIPVEPFAFAGGPDQPTEFTVESIIDDVRFEYAVELNRHEVLYEGLFHYPEKKRRRIFERQGQDLKLQRGLGNLSGTRELLTSRTLALTVARRFDEPLVSAFADDLLRVQVIGLRRARSTYSIGVLTPPRSVLRWFEGPPAPEQPGRSVLREQDGFAWDQRERALALLQLADLGIDDVLIDQEEIPLLIGQESAMTALQRRVRLVHRTGDERAPLDYAAESEGTRTWFQLIGPVLTALHYGSLLLFDELDASLHPTLSAQLIHLFHDPTTNPNGAQLVFTSHDTSLLNHLNRDEVWLTEKTASGSTRLGALAEFAGERVRTSQNLERAYLNGRFGALPDVDRTELLRILGLIG